MFDSILEHPFVVGVVGIFVSLIILWGWLQTANKAALYLGLSALLLTVILFVLGNSIETENEKLLRWLNATASELEANQLDRVKAKIHPAASNNIRDLAGRAESLVFSQARITRVHEIDFKGSAPYDHAVVKINVAVDVNYSGSVQKILRYVELTLYRVDGRWLVYNVRHEEPTYGLKLHDD